MKHDARNIYVTQRGPQIKKTGWSANIRKVCKQENCNSIKIYVSAERGSVSTEIKYSIFIENGVFGLTPDSKNGKAFKDFVHSQKGGRPVFEKTVEKTSLPKSFWNAIENSKSGKVCFFVSIQQDGDLYLISKDITVPNSLDEVKLEWKNDR